MTDKSAIRWGIIGGTGRMGQWLAAEARDAGHEVVVSGRSTGPSVEELAASCNIVVLSVPNGPALDMAQSIGPLLSPDQLLTDLCSLKADICHAMHDGTPAQVVGLHPLFGPNIDSLSGQNVVLCPMRGTSWADWLQGFFQDRGAVVTRCAPEIHDRNMAVVQSLTHFVTIAFGETLRRLGLAPEDLMAFSTPIFRFKLDLVGRLCAQDLGLYTDLIAKNPLAPEVLAAFRETAADVGTQMSECPDGQAPALLEQLRSFLGDFCDQALAETEKRLGRGPDREKTTQGPTGRACGRD